MQTTTVLIIGALRYAQSNRFDELDEEQMEEHLNVSGGASECLWRSI